MGEGDPSGQYEDWPTAEDFGVSKEIFDRCINAIARIIDEVGLAQLLDEMDPETRDFYLEKFRGEANMAAYFAKFFGE